MMSGTLVDVLLIFKHLSEIFRNTIFSQKFSNGEIVMRLKKKIKAAAGWIGKKNSPGRSSGNKSIFFWPSHAGKACLLRGN